MAAWFSMTAALRAGLRHPRFVLVSPGVPEGAAAIGHDFVAPMRRPGQARGLRAKPEARDAFAGADQ
jgi:hypothetical protein